VVKENSGSSITADIGYLWNVMTLAKTMFGCAPGSRMSTSLSVARATGGLCLSGLVTLSVACTPPAELPEQEELECNDLRQEWAPQLADSYFVEVPTMVVEPGTEAIFCLYGTYEGPDAGIVSFIPEWPGGFLHHSLMKRVDEFEYDDGTLFDCTALEFQWPPKPTLVESVGADGEDWIDLPEGIGFKFDTGQRWVTDVHYVNTSDEKICVNTAFELELIPEEELVGYAGTFNLDAGRLDIPPSTTSSTSFACAWPNDVNILSIGGHMHELGIAYDVQRLYDDGPSETIYHVDPWLPEYRYQPPFTNFDVGEFTMAAGEQLLTECTWTNPTDEALSYPDEMCTTWGVAFPLESSFHCDGGDEPER